MTDDQPFHWYAALDGADLDGLTGDAGLLRFDWPARHLEHRFYPGVSAGHNVSCSPDGKLILLGNLAQTVLVVDAATLEERGRQSTMAIEECRSRFRSNTHHLWLGDRQFVCCVGDNLYRFRLDDLAHPESLGPHGLLSPHEIRWTADGRGIYVFKREGLPVRIFRLDPWTGKKEFVKEFMPADPGGITGMSTVTMSPDAKVFAFNYRRRISELFLVEGLR